MYKFLCFFSFLIIVFIILDVCRKLREHQRQRLKLELQQLMHPQTNGCRFVVYYNVKEYILEMFWQCSLQIIIAYFYFLDLVFKNLLTDLS